MPRASEYDPVAELYDVFVRADFDLEFFRSEAQRCGGTVLELMAGTGRVTAAILEASSNVTCVDSSFGMLRVLHRKLVGRGHGLSVVCSDVRALPLNGPYGLVVIPFHSFAELTQSDDRRSALREIRRVLAPGGRFICTLQNPSIRADTLDGDNSLLGTFQRPNGLGHLELWVRGTLDAGTRVAESTQACKVYDSAGTLESEQVYSIRFALLEHDEFQEVAREAGFMVAECYGDYARTAFDPKRSPYMIWVLNAG